MSQIVETNSQALEHRGRWCTKGQFLETKRQKILNTALFPKKRLGRSLSVFSFPGSSFENVAHETAGFGSQGSTSQLDPLRPHLLQAVNPSSETGRIHLMLPDDPVLA
jgi:hypothetical protein